MVRACVCVCVHACILMYCRLHSAFPSFSLSSLLTLLHLEEDRKELSSFAKNYLPILFNLYTAELREGSTNRGHILECVKSYASIAPPALMGTFFSKILDMLRQSDLAVDDKYVRQLLISPAVLLTVRPHVCYCCPDHVCCVSHWIVTP